MSQCLSCQNNLKNHFLSLGNSPFSNSYLSKEQLNLMEATYPLDLYLCDNCYLVQLEQFEQVESIFNNDYAYHSSFSKSWLRHASDYTNMITDRFNLNEKSFVMEIASNDGYLLQYFKEKNIPCLGIEPTKSTAEVAISKGIETELCFFDTLYAENLSKKNKLSDLIIGNNVLAHNPNLNDFVAGLKIALKSDGIITMEFPHLLSLIQENQFDTVYHEHFSYFSLYTVKYLFNNYGLDIFDVDKLSTHGGSLRIYAKHKSDNSKEISSKVAEVIEEEKINGLFEIKTYTEFKERVEKTKRNLLSFLIKLKNEGKKIVGYGAPAKGNTLINYCGIRNDFLDYTVDISPYKQNKFLPGSHIPIMPPEILKENKPDYILVLPWNLKKEITEQLSYVKEWDCKFIIPIPELMVI